jgi:hypothetical protein
MVTQRRTDNAMANKKMSKGQTIIYKKLHRKQNIEPHELTTIWAKKSHLMVYLICLLTNVDYIW